MTPKDPMAKDFRELCRDSMQEWATHPSIEQLALYLRHELPPDSQERLREHLATCKSCQRELLDLHAFRDAVEESTRRADLGRCPPGLPRESDPCCKSEVDRVWDELWQTLSEGTQPKGIVNVGGWPHWNMAFGWTRISVIVLLTASLTWTSLFIYSWRHSPPPVEIAACEKTLIERCVLSASCLGGVPRFWHPLIRTLGGSPEAWSRDFEWLWDERSRSSGYRDGLRLEECGPNGACLGWSQGAVRGSPKAASCEDLAGSS